ncbi:MAG: hypothetical protein MZV65_19215 [Chromatiales bacterium]|nr:hypothetical protein [Chromatiales bacterium]
MIYRHVARPADQWRIFRETMRESVDDHDDHRRRGAVQLHDVAAVRHPGDRRVSIADARPEPLAADARLINLFLLVAGMLPAAGGDHPHG